MFRIVIVTKEKGKIIFNDEISWKKFKLSSVTLHSTTEPAIQEYYFNNVINRGRFVWFLNGKHHRPFFPSVYIIDKNKKNEFNHNFENFPDNYDEFIKYYTNNQISMQFYLEGKKIDMFPDKNFNNFMYLSNKYNRYTKLKEIFNER